MTVITERKEQQQHQHDIASVRLAGGTWADDLRAVKMVWKRELIRFGRNRLRIVTSLAQPVLFLFVLGTGLSTIVRGGPATTGTGGRRSAASSARRRASS